MPPFYTVYIAIFVVLILFCIAKFCNTLFSFVNGFTTNRNNNILHIIPIKKAKNMDTTKINNMPRFWVPTLYFTEALPYAAVMILSTVMYKNLGLSNTDLALYTSWLYLPWVIKPLWSPLVDRFGTKRGWVILTQSLVAIGLASLAFSLSAAFWLQASLACFWLIAFASATHDIAADGFYIIALDDHQQSFYTGIRNTFYRIATIFAQGALVILVGWLAKEYDMQKAWSFTYGILAIVMLILIAIHVFLLPKVEQTQTIVNKNAGFSATIKTFLSKPQLIPVLIFILFYRFPEAQLGKISSPFMLDSVASGGMGLSTENVGFIYGTIGMIGLTLGGLLGGFLVAKDGLKKWLWPMVMSISLPDAVYIYLAAYKPDNLLIINSCVFVEQFGYGLGYTAYSLYLLYFSKGENSTSVYAICTGIMALGMMLPGMISGYMCDLLGYYKFFWWVFLCCLITVGVSAIIKVDPEFGKKSKQQ